MLVNASKALFNLTDFANLDYATILWPVANGRKGASADLGLLL